MCPAHPSLLSSNPRADEHARKRIGRVVAHDAGMDEHITPEPILQLGLAFWGSKTLLTAVELGLFTELAAQGASEEATLARRLGLHGRGANDFRDALVAFGMLQRDATGRYDNTPQAAMFLDGAKPTYI